MTLILEQELNTIKGLLHYLNDLSEAPIHFDIDVFDSNGDKIGSLSKHLSSYAFFTDGE